MSPKRLVFRLHAVQRMFERRITGADVRHILESGEVIEHYPDDEPYPGRLVLGFSGARPIHVVSADNHDQQETIAITAYTPDRALWDRTFRRRKLT